MANTAIISGILTGCLLMALTVISQMSILFEIRSHRGDEPIPMSMINWLFVTVGIGSICGSVVFSFLAEKVGRKYTLTALVLFIAKFIAGLSSGGTYVVVPIYIGEVAEKTSRGRLIALMNPSLAIANFFINGVLDPLGGYGSSSIINYISASLAIIATILSVTLVEESPFYYLTMGRELAAKSSLVKLRSNHSNHQMEFNEIQNKVQPNIPNIEVGVQVSTSVKYSWLKPLLLMTGILGLKSLSGISSLNFFMAYVAQSADWDWSLITILYSAVHLLASFVILFIIDKYGRKLPLLVSVIWMSITFIFLYILVLLGRYNIHISPYLLLVASLISYLAIDIGVGPIPFVLLGELFPLRNKMMCAGISMVLHFTLLFFSPMVMLWINNTGPGPYFNIIISIVVAILLSILVKYFYPETKGKSLNEIQVEINQNSPPNKNSRIVIE